MQCLSPISVKTTTYPVPCGRCYACLENKRKEWSIRMNEEARHSIACYFVTFTYDDYHSDGNVWKKHIQDFFKRYRHIYKGKFKYYCVAEYAPETYRPHYHLHLFYRTVMTAEQLYKDLTETWTFGLIHIGNTEQGSVYYSTKHHLTRWHTPDGLNATFTLMSKRPPIGSDYVIKNKTFHRSIKKAYYKENGYLSALPRYYKDKLYSKFQKQQIAARNAQRQVEFIDFEKWKKRFPKKNEHEYFNDLNKYKENLERLKINNAKKTGKL